MTFLEYLKTQRHRRDDVGDLANHAITDRSEKQMRGTTTLGLWRRYLLAEGAYHDALNALDTAWDEYIDLTDEEGA